MQYTVEVKDMPAKEYLVIPGFVELGGSTPDSYAVQVQQMEARVADGSVARLQAVSGSATVHALFCNTCVLDEATGGYICGNDIACENVNHAASGDGFEIVRLDTAMYAVFDCSFDGDITVARAFQQVDDIYWGEWLHSQPYESMIETTTGANTLGIAAVSSVTAMDDGFAIKIHYPIRRKEA